MRLLFSIAVYALCASVIAETAQLPFPEELTSKDALETSAEMLVPGVQHRYIHFANPFGDGPVAVNFLVIDWKQVSKNFTLGVVFCGGTRKRPTTMFDATNAFAAVNGTYHTTKDPTTPYYQLKIDGVFIPSQYSSGDMAFAFNKGEMPVITKCTPEVLTNYQNVISGDNVNPFATMKQADTKEKRQKARAPRTFIGQDTNGVTVIVVADGRTKRSIGLDFVEECRLVMPFGCQMIVSMDGGGSSVMALRDGGKHKIVSHPSDNGFFDAGGERRVCDSIMLFNGDSND